MTDPGDAPGSGPDRLTFGPLFDPAPSDTLDRFVQGLARGQLLATVCSSCQRVFLPPRGGCTCGAGSMEWIPIAPRGRLLTFTRVHYGPAGLAGSEPYTLGVVQLERDLRLLARVTVEHADGSAAPELVPGLEVQVVPTQMAPGNYTLELVPVSGSPEGLP